ncbi:MAG: hypothetical protein M0R06_05905 [Sphaerochaeta sp.]|jgi:hypothetical protein|nr:hypothetical protein [Sphaerochaeta sp.]
MTHFWNQMLGSVGRHARHFRQLAAMMFLLAAFVLLGMVLVFDLNGWLSLAIVMVFFTFAYGLAFGILTVLFAMKDMVEGRWD